MGSSDVVGGLLGTMFLGIVGWIVVLLICREIVCWYWKINEAIGLLGSIDQSLRVMSGRPATIIAPGPSAAPPPTVAVGVNTSPSGESVSFPAQVHPWTGTGEAIVSFGPNGRSAVVDTRGATLRSIAQALHGVRIEQNVAQLDIIVARDSDAQRIEEACFDDGRGFKLQGVGWRTVA